MSSLYVSAATQVFWDLDDFPVPPSETPESFRKNLEAALEMEGYILMGKLIISAYDGGKLSDNELQHFRLAEIGFRERGADKNTRLNSMLTEMISWALENHPPIPGFQEVNMLVIAKDIPEGNTEFFNVCKGLQARNYNVFLTVPHDFPPEEVPPFNTASLVWRWPDLFYGGIPIESDTDDED